MHMIASLLIATSTSIQANNNIEVSDSLSKIDLIENTSLTYSSPSIPEEMNFAGSEIDLRRFDRREKLDKEILAVTYMHSTTLQMIKRANRYFPVIEPILKENNIPDDLKYLMVIESSVNPLAKSGAGAAGLWQFMPSTAKEYGIEVNGCVDERYDVEKATVAACKYLKNAYAKYGDWPSVAASYNAGQGRISHQLNRQNVTNSLDLHLVEETSRYVYRILAAKLLFTSPAEFGFRLRSSDLYPQLKTKSITVTTSISDLNQWANEQGTTLAFLKMLNPWLRDNNLINRNGKEYIIQIPTEDGLYYDTESIKAYNPAWVVE